MKKIDPGFFPVKILIDFCFDLYARRPDFSEGKNGNRQWENLENERKKTHQDSKNENNYFLCYFIVLSKKYFLY